MSLGLLLTLKEAAKLSASSSRPGLAEGGGLPTMELPGEWPDRPGGDLTQTTVRNIVRRLSLSLSHLAVARGGDIWTPGRRFSSSFGGLILSSDKFCGAEVILL